MPKSGSSTNGTANKKKRKNKNKGGLKDRTDQEKVELKY